jgi:lysophospholipase L1-like esterase
MVARASVGDRVRVTVIKGADPEYVFEIARGGGSNLQSWFTIKQSEIQSVTGWKVNQCLGICGWPGNSDLIANAVYRDTGKGFTNLLSKMNSNNATFNIWNTLGDSITEIDTYQSMVASMLDIPVVHNYGISGTRIAATSVDDTDCMSTRYSWMSDDADLITVFGGTNDWGNLHLIDLGQFSDNTRLTFYGAMHILCKGLITKYPSKTIAFFTPIQGIYNALSRSDLNPKGYTLADVADAILEVCSFYSIPVLDLYRCGGITGNVKDDTTHLYTFTYDGTHPNEVGFQRLAKKMATFIRSL